jgi:hypothetical protein
MCGPCPRATSHSLMQVTGKRVIALVPLSLHTCSDWPVQTHCVDYLQRRSAPRTALNRSTILGVVVEVQTCPQPWFGSQG